MAERPIILARHEVRTILTGRRTQLRRLVRPEHCPTKATRITDAIIGGRGGHRMREWLQFTPKTNALIEWMRPGAKSHPGARRPTRAQLRRAMEWHRRREPRWTSDEVVGLCPDVSFGFNGEVDSTLWGKETWYDDTPGEQDRGEVHYRADHDCRSWEAGCPCANELGRSEWRSSLSMPRWASRLSLEVTAVRIERVRSASDEDARASGYEIAFGPGMFSRCFDSFWDEVHGEGSWLANPWVWVLVVEQKEPGR